MLVKRELQRWCAVVVVALIGAPGAALAGDGVTVGGVDRACGGGVGEVVRVERGVEPCVVPPVERMVMIGPHGYSPRPERTFGGHYRGPRADVRMYFGGAAADLSRDHGAHYRGPRGPRDAHYHHPAQRPEVTVVRNPRRVMVIVAVPRQLEAAPVEQEGDELIVHGRDGGWGRIRPSSPGQATEAGSDTDRADAQPRDGDRPQTGQAAADSGEGVAEESEATSAADNAAGPDAS